MFRYSYLPVALLLRLSLIRLSLCAIYSLIHLSHSLPPLNFRFFLFTCHYSLVNMRYLLVLFAFLYALVTCLKRVNPGPVQCHLAAVLIQHLGSSSNQARTAPVSKLLSPLPAKSVTSMRRCDRTESTSAQIALLRPIPHTPTRTLPCHLSS